MDNGIKRDKFGMSVIPISPDMSISLLSFLISTNPFILLLIPSHQSYPPISSTNPNITDILSHTPILYGIPKFKKNLIFDQIFDFAVWPISTNYKIIQFTKLDTPRFKEHFINFVSYVAI